MYRSSAETKCLLDDERTLYDLHGLQDYSGDREARQK